MKKRLLVGLAFIISVGIHFGSFVSLYLMPKEKAAPSRPMEVTLISPNDKKTDPNAKKTEDQLRQIVEQNKSVNTDTPDNAKYLSQFNQKVKKETRAAQTGKFQNTGGQGQAKSTEAQKAEAAQPEQKVAEKVQAPAKKSQTAKAKSQPKFTVGSTQTFDPTAPSAMESLKPSYDWTKSVRERDFKEELAAKAGGDGNAISQTNDYLPDQEKSIQTQLNTREFMYYSYYNRIKQQLNQFWEPKIKEKVTDMFRHGRHVASNSDHITKLLIILNAQGNLVGVKVLGPSGETSLDEAAVEAFQAAAPFPNPPKGIVESDGTIKIRWDFILEV